MFLKIKMFVALFLSIGVCSSGLCTEGFHSVDEFGQWVTFYYLHPQPNQVTKAVRYFSDSTAYGTNSTMPTVAFFASVLERDEAMLKRTYEEISADGSENSKMTLLNILKLINTETSCKMLSEAKERWSSPRLKTVADNSLKHPFKPLLTVVVDSPLILDMLWSTFFANGDVKPILRILSALESRDPTVSGAARWSVASNIKQHARVREICLKELAKSTGKKRAVLEDILSQSK